MTDPEFIPYVRAVSAVLGMPLDDARTHRVALHLARTAALARQLDAYPLQEADEPAEIYRPAPFPCGSAAP
jgi:hypothetical protein